MKELTILIERGMRQNFERNKTIIYIDLPK